MYSPKIIAAKATAIEATYPIKLKELGINEVAEWIDRLNLLVHPDSTPNNPKLVDRKSTRLNSSHIQKSRMPSSA